MDAHRAEAAAIGLFLRPRLPEHMQQQQQAVDVLVLRQDEASEDAVQEVASPSKYTRNETMYLRTTEGLKGVLQTHMVACWQARNAGFIL